VFDVSLLQLFRFPHRFLRRDAHLRDNAAPHNSSQYTGNAIGSDFDQTFCRNTHSMFDK